MVRNISAKDALARLQEGNARFVAHVRSAETLARQLLRAELASGQQPFAVVLGCSDSRVPAELIFDQGLGDLFVIRVAGNIVAPSQIGSVEFAVELFDVQLVIVLGHTLCGAVEATLESMRHGTSTESRHINSIVSRIRPALVDCRVDTEDRESLMRSAVDANIRASVSQLCHGSEIIERRISEGRLEISGALYDLKTGLVEFYS